MDERSLQNGICERLAGLGWERARNDSELGRPVDDVIGAEDLTAALIRLNPLIAERPEERAQAVIAKLRAILLSANNDGLVAANEEFTAWMCGRRTVQYVGTEQHEQVKLIDFENPRANTLRVTAEATYRAGREQRRYDIVLWVNGLPLVVGETKKPGATTSWLNAATDIHNGYEAKTTAFFVPNVASFATDGRDFRYGAVRQPPEQWLKWAKTTDPIAAEGLAAVMRSAELLLAPETVLEILAHFTLYSSRRTAQGAQRHKIIPRYPQVEAVEAIVERCRDPHRRQGLIWHHQGSGKTFAMAFAAAKLRHIPEMDAPTIVVVLDRLDLIDQTIDEFTSVGIGGVKVAENRAQLRKMLSQDARGVIITTIYRFKDSGGPGDATGTPGGAGPDDPEGGITDPGDLGGTGRATGKIGDQDGPVGASVVNDRTNIVVMVDEAHRTQEGRLGLDMRAALPNAKFIGLTGTPVATDDRNTWAMFGDPGDPDGVLSHYSVERSIHDGATLPVHVETRLVDSPLASAALDQAFAERAEAEQLDDNQQELLARKAGHLAVVVRDDDRIEAVCADIVAHYRRRIAPLGLKAQIVVYDRAACVAYHEAIAKLLGPGEEATVVMTAAKDDPPEWRQWDRDRDAEAQVKDRFRDIDDPLKLLIVTAKLLTGFDAPIEGVMYLDKPLRAHTLFQAVCRTNRRWTNPRTGQEKMYGLVVDYVGMGEELAKAVAIKPRQPGADPAEGDIETLLAELTGAIADCARRFAGIDRAKKTFEQVFEAQNILGPDSGDESDRRVFAREFLRCQGLFEFLYPEPRLKDREDDYRFLARVYASIAPSNAADMLLWQRLGTKTMALVHEHLTAVEIRGDSLDQVVLDAETLEYLKDNELVLIPSPEAPAPPPEADEVLDRLEERIRRKTEGTDPHRVWRSLAERLEELRAAKLADAEASVEFLKRIIELAKDLVRAERADEEGRLDEIRVLDPRTGALTQIFREYAPETPPAIVEQVVEEVDELVAPVRGSGWQTSVPQDQEVRKQLRLILRKHSLPPTGDLFDRAYAYIREHY